MCVNQSDMWDNIVCVSQSDVWDKSVSQMYGTKVSASQICGTKIIDLPGNWQKVVCVSQSDVRDNGYCGSASQMFGLIDSVSSRMV